MAGTDHSASRSPGDPTADSWPAVVLVRPQLPENIGAAARAMRNCGLADLRLVSPRDGWPGAAPDPVPPEPGEADGAGPVAPRWGKRRQRLTPDQVFERACALASGAADVLENARIFSNTADAVADLQLLYATTARPRDLHKRVLNAEAAAAEAVAGVRQGVRVGFLFGPERTGLETDDLILADTLVTIPLNPGFTSLNLGQAVLLLSHALWRARGAMDDPAPAPSPPPPRAPDAPAEKDAVAAFLAHLEQELDAARFVKSEIKRAAIYRALRNLFVHARPTVHEVSLLHGVVTALSGRRLGGSLRGAPREQTDDDGARDRANGVGSPRK